MPRLIFVICITSLFVPLSYAQIYKWTDARGVVHFSDSPQPGAKPISLPEAQTFSTPAIAPKIEENTAAHKEEQKYTKIAITQPLNEATIRNNEGFLSVVIELEPTLAPKDRVQLILDGAPLGDPQASTLMQLNGIYRGSHTLAVQALDAQSQVLLTSDTITFFMQRPRVNMGNIPRLPNNTNFSR